MDATCTSRATRGPLLGRASTDAWRMCGPRRRPRSGGVATERERLQLAQETAAISVTSARVALAGRDGRRREVPLADITDVVVGAAGSRAGAG